MSFHDSSLFSVQSYCFFLKCANKFCFFCSKKIQKCKKKKSVLLFFSSATRTRTGVYGVRGRCPRPLDDSTRSGLPLNGRSGLRPKGLQRALSQFWPPPEGAMCAPRTKAGAKVLLFFELTKFFNKKMHFRRIFFFGTLFVACFMYKNRCI